MNQIRVLLRCDDNMPESHSSEDVIEVVGGEEVLLLDVEEVEAQLEHLDLVHLQRGRLGDLVKVDVRKLCSTIQLI